VSGPGNAWRLLQLHVVRPGRIVTPDLLLTRAFAGGPATPRGPVAVQRLLTHPAIQLEPGDWAVAPGLATVRALETYEVPVLALLEGGALAWLFLARQALARADRTAPVELLMDGRAIAAPTPPEPPGDAVAADTLLAAAEPLAERACILLSARAGDLVLADTRIELEPIA